jgi:hypothetical protein
MAARKPIVNVSGTDSELPGGDYLADPVLATLSQIAGLDGTTLLEVEANTKAGRVTLRPTDAGSLGEQAFDVTHHSIGASSNFSATTTFTSSDLLFIGWFITGLMVIRKLWVTISTSALTGARAGNGAIFLRELKPLLGSVSSNLLAIPPQATIGNNLNLGTASVQNFHSLRQRQGAPQCLIGLPTANTAPNGSMNWTGSVVPSTQSSAQILFGVKSQIGIDLPPTMLIDVAAGQQPLILESSQGLVLGISYPAAATSQVVNFSVNAVWDEWVPVPPVVL